MGLHLQKAFQNLFMHKNSFFNRKGINYYELSRIVLLIAKFCDQV